MIVSLLLMTCLFCVGSTALIDRQIINDPKDMPYYEALIQRSILIEKSPLQFVYDYDEILNSTEILKDTCSFEIRTGSCSGYEMPTARPGDELCFAWNCTLPGYGIRVENCSVISPHTGNKIPLIDHNGCGTPLMGMLVMGTPSYRSNLREVTQMMHMLRFAHGQDSAKFECAIRVCPLCLCSNILPPSNCPDVDELHQNTKLNQSEILQECSMEIPLALSKSSSLNPFCVFSQFLVLFLFFLS